MSLWRSKGLCKGHRWVFIPVSEAQLYLAWQWQASFPREAEDQTSGGKWNSTSFLYGEESLELNQGLPWCCPRVSLWAEPCSLRPWVTWASGVGQNHKWFSILVSTPTMFTGTLNQCPVLPPYLLLITQLNQRKTCKSNLGHTGT